MTSLYWDGTQSPVSTIFPGKRIPIISIRWLLEPSNLHNVNPYTGKGPVTQRFMAWSRPKPVKKWSPMKQTMLFVLMSSLRRATVDLKTWQDAGKNRNGVGRSKKFWTAQNFSPRTTTRGTHGKDLQHTVHLIIRVPAVIKTWGDAVRRESLGICHGQSRVIGRVLHVGITRNSLCLADYHWQIYFSVLRQCLGSASTMERPPPAVPRHKARPSQNWPKFTTYDHVHQIFITSCTCFRRGVLCDRGLRLHPYIELHKKKQAHKKKQVMSWDPRKQGQLDQHQLDIDPTLSHWIDVYLISDGLCFQGWLLQALCSMLSRHCAGINRFCR